MTIEMMQSSWERRYRKDMRAHQRREHTRAKRTALKEASADILDWEDETMQSIMDCYDDYFHDPYDWSDYALEVEESDSYNYYGYDDYYSDSGNWRDDDFYRDLEPLNSRVERDFEEFWALHAGEYGADPAHAFKDVARASYSAGRRKTNTYRLNPRQRQDMAEWRTIGKEPDMPAYSLLIAWANHDHEQGNYSWFGHAESLEQAERKARVESLISDDRWPDDEDRGADEILRLDGDAFYYWTQTSGAACGDVLDSFEGVNIWQAKELLDALKLARDRLRINNCEGEEDEFIAEIEAVISAAEGSAS